MPLGGRDLDWEIIIKIGADNRHYSACRPIRNEASYQYSRKENVEFVQA
jgi:hypothetical protein